MRVWAGRKALDLKAKEDLGKPVSLTTGTCGYIEMIEPTATIEYENISSVP